jgi:endonuclease/exonuclease/phosphatase family metal-dependent hydrolase
MGFRFRILTWNIGGGVWQGRWERYLAPVADVIRGTNASLVLIVEVASDEQARQLGALSGLEHHVFGDGRAIFSRFPISGSSTVALIGSDGAASGDTALHAPIFVNNQYYQVICIHSNYTNPCRRFRAAEGLVAFSGQLPDPLLIGGDFNGWPTSQAAQIMKSAMTEGWVERPEPDYNCGNNEHRGDYIYYRGRFHLWDYDYNCPPLNLPEVDHPFVLLDLEDHYTPPPLTPRLRVTVVSPSDPIQLLARTQLNIHAENAYTHDKVAGTVIIDNFTTAGQPTRVQFPTDVTREVTLRCGRAGRRIIFPSGRVTASTYPIASVPFHFDEGE